MILKFSEGKELGNQNLQESYKMEKNSTHYYLDNYLDI